jgi:hypothetical protein
VPCPLNSPVKNECCLTVLNDARKRGIGRNEEPKRVIHVKMGPKTMCPASDVPQRLIGVLFLKFDLNYLDITTIYNRMIGAWVQL